LDGLGGFSVLSLKRPSGTRREHRIRRGSDTGLFGAAWAQDELRKILRTIGAKVVDRQLALAQAHQQFDERGSLLSADLHEQLVAHIYELLDAASAFRLTAQTTS
jgi:chromate reductase